MGLVVIGVWVCVCVALNGTKDCKGQSRLHIRMSSPSSGGCSVIWGPISAVVSADTKKPDVARGVAGV